MDEVVYRALYPKHTWVKNYGCGHIWMAQYAVRFLKSNISWKYTVLVTLYSVDYRAVYFQLGPFILHAIIIVSISELKFLLHKLES